MIKRSTGFTLIELMIVVVVVSILAAVAIPNYTEYLRKTRRADAMAVLQQFSNAMERYRLTNGNYTGADDAGVPGVAMISVFPPQSPLDAGTKFYDLTIEALTQTTYTLRATPIPGTGQAFDGIIELDSTGARRWDEGNDFPLWQAIDNNWIVG